MTMDAVPDPIRRYLDAAAQQDHDGVAEAFTENATVTDEGQTMSGHDAIRQWSVEVNARYSFSTREDSARLDGSTWFVDVTLEGDFPGRVAHLEQRYDLVGDRIGSLSIR